MAFCWASDAPEARRTPLETLAHRHADSGFATRYYTPEVHQAAFALPPYIGELVA
jgi:spermidine synthase